QVPGSLKRSFSMSIGKEQDPSMKKLLLLAGISILSVSALAANDRGNPCSGSPVDPIVCKSRDGKTEIDLYDTRASHVDYYNGLNELAFCEEGYLKINGVENAADGSDIAGLTSVSNEYGLKLLTPEKRTISVEAVASFAFSEKAQKSFGLSGAEFLFFGLTEK